MNRVELVKRVRRLVHDPSNSVFEEEGIVDYINEAIQRIRQVIPELLGMVELGSATDSPILLPSEYHHLISVYGASRCFDQDERFYQATTRMNEFETKIEDLRAKIELGEIVILDAQGNAIAREYEGDYVTENYFNRKGIITDLDEGVEVE